MVLLNEVIMKDFDEFVNYVESLKLYRQSRVKRWQLRDYVFTENDSEHMLYTSQLIVILVKMFNIPDDIAYKALSYGCCHDFVESTEESLGDVNYMVKEKNPELKMLVKKLEYESIKNVPAFFDAMENCELDEKAKLLVSFADSLEALLYVNREIKFNIVKDEWIQIKDELMIRITEYWNKLNTIFK